MILLGLFYWSNFVDIENINKLLTVNISEAVLSATILLISLVTYFWTPKKHIFAFSLLIYLLFIINSSILIINTGNLSSPFLILWIIIGLSSDVFGIWGLIPALSLAGVFTAIQYINGNFKNENIITIIMAAFIPIILSLIIWRSKNSRDENSSENKAYQNLANELSEVANKSEVVINAIGDGVIAIDNQGVIQLINPTAQEIIGWGKQDALALNYKSVIHLVNQKDEALDASNDPIQQALNINQQIRTNSLTLMTKSGKKIMISLVVSPVGEVGSGVIIVFHDVTKEKAEEREQAEFISTASHEMRTPVASIEGYLGLALNPQTATVDDRGRDFIQKAQASAQHLGRLFQDLLDISKADDGRISNNPKVIDVVVFVHDIVQGLKQKAIDKGLKITYKPIPDIARERHIAPVYYINLDNDHVREIVNNLVENAIKYTPHGEIIIDVAGDDDHVTISVKDSGIGIPIEDMSHLFQKFYRVDNVNTRDIGGTGLGLYLSRRLAEIMGGRIWADSAYGTGSTFFLELPRVNSQQAELLINQEEFRQKQEANRLASNQPQKPVQAIVMNQPVSQPVVGQPVIQQPITTTPQSQSQIPRSVPRGQALTPEQIAAYVTRQRALAQQQYSTQPANRPQSMSVPPRGLVQ